MGRLNIAVLSIYKDVHGQTLQPSWKFLLLREAVIRAIELRTIVEATGPTISIGVPSI